MNRLIKIKTPTLLFLMMLLLTCVALPQSAQAVSPAPDGGYPGGNTAEGQNALFSLTTGGYNTAVGFFSLRNNTTSPLNTAIGAGALFANRADQNTATGAGALFNNTSGRFNTANGVFALFANTTGFFNTATGEALYANTTGSDNIANGAGALALNTTGSDNTALGFQAGLNATTGSNNVYIGSGMNGIAGESNACYIASIFGETIDPATATLVGVNANNKLGTVSSSKRFKHDIKPMDKASEAILALKPVTFHYKSDAKNTLCFGLIAEEVAEVNPDLVVRDHNGEIYTVRYDQVNAMLLNEFLKEHREVEQQHREMEEQKAAITRQQKQIDALTQGLQKVSAQLEVSKAAPQTVLNSQ